MFSEIVLYYILYSYILCPYVQYMYMNVCIYVHVSLGPLDEIVIE